MTNLALVLEVHNLREDIFLGEVFLNDGSEKADHEENLPVFWVDHFGGWIFHDDFVRR